MSATGLLVLVVVLAVFLVKPLRRQLLSVLGKLFRRVDEAVSSPRDLDHDAQEIYRKMDEAVVKMNRKISSLSSAISMLRLSQERFAKVGAQDRAQALDVKITRLEELYKASLGRRDKYIVAMDVRKGMMKAKLTEAKAIGISAETLRTIKGIAVEVDDTAFEIDRVEEIIDEELAKSEGELTFATDVTDARS